MVWSQVKFEYERVQSCLLRQDRKAPHKGREFPYVHAPQNSKLQSPLSHLRWLDLYEATVMNYILKANRYETWMKQKGKELSNICTDMSFIEKRSFDGQYRQKYLLVNTLSSITLLLFLSTKICLSHKDGIKQHNLALHIEPSS